MRWISPGWRRVLVGGAAVALAAGAVTYTGSASSAYADVEVRTDAKTGADGKQYWVQNHLVSADLSRIGSEPDGQRKEWLLVWAGDENIADTVVKDVKNLPGTISGGLNKVKNALPGPDFLAVIDATKGSPTYGKVVNTATVGPLVENEPHHMQYVWHKGDTVYAGALFAAATYAFDVSALPELKLKGISLPTQTLGGSVPDAYWTLKDGTAYATYMGGPNVAGACTYSNGEVRIGNGFAGTPGEIVHIGKDGRTLAEAPAAAATAEDPEQCGSVPQLPVASCANPHGLAVREDLNRLVASDFLEPRDFLSPQAPPEERLTRNTVRIFDITDRGNPKLTSVGTLPAGPRAALENDPFWDESRVVMETATTRLPQHKGAFAATMNGGAVYYTPDITAGTVKWREIFDDTTAYRRFQSDSSVRGGGDNSSWIFVSPDDKLLFHAVMGQSVPYGAPLDRTTGMVYVLDIRKLLAGGAKYKCTIDELSEVFHGGRERDCPALVDVLPIRDVTSGGPHWGTMDTFAKGPDGTFHETRTADRIAVANYFLANSFGGDGDHRVCMLTVSRTGHLAVDTAFRDEHTGQPCVSFNRASWPHGDYGDSRPHGVLFAVSDRPLRR